MMQLSSFRKYLILFEQSLQVALAYRVRFFTSLLIGLIQVLVLYYIWRVVYAQENELAGFTLAQMVTYIFISYAIRNLYSFYTETTISSGIRDGSVTADLIRPLNYQSARFFESLGAVVVESIMVGILVFGVGVWFFKIQGPSSTEAGILFSISVVLSLVVNFALGFIVGLFSFWTTSVFGFINTKRFISDFFSGGLVPLALFPEWLRTIALLLPFNTLVHLPASIYLGQLRGIEAIQALFVQLSWAVLLWVGGHLLWLQASKKITIHGG